MHLKKTKILLIDDSEDDFFFFERIINKSSLKVEIDHSIDSNEGLNAIRNKNYDCIFLDYSLPGLDGLAVLKKIRTEGFNIPVIILTGQKNEQLIVKLMQEGATDYLSKESLSSEIIRLSIDNAKKTHSLYLEKKLTEEALKKSETKLREAQRIAHIGNWEYNFVSTLFYFSDEAFNILNQNDNLVNPSYLKFLKIVHPEDQTIIHDCLKNLKGDISYNLNFRIFTQDREIKYINAKGHLMMDENEQAQKIVGTLQDVTLLKTALEATRKAKAGKKATTIVLSIAIGLFILSEAVLDPYIDAISTSILVGLSFKGGIALFLKPIESFLENAMKSRIL